ncbi:MAG TPA: hypothetical protein PLJ88_05195 [Agitococcus sp.]|nr:hypothetical protein [Agitococcus sp.]
MNDKTSVGEHPLERELDALSKRHGLFVIPMHLLNSNHSSVLKIMSKCFIYRAEAMYLKDWVEYVARSECFDELELGEYMPQYDWIVDENGDVYAKRISI